MKSVTNNLSGLSSCSASNTERVRVKVIQIKLHDPCEPVRQNHIFVFVDYHQMLYMYIE